MCQISSIVQHHQRNLNIQTLCCPLHCSSPGLKNNILPLTSFPEAYTDLIASWTDRGACGMDLEKSCKFFQDFRPSHVFYSTPNPCSRRRPHCWFIPTCIQQLGKRDRTHLTTEEWSILLQVYSFLPCWLTTCMFPAILLFGSFSLHKLVKLSA